MASLFHIAEVAVLLFLAYAAGWAIGYGTRRLIIRERKPADVPGERVDRATDLAVAASASAAGQVAETPDVPVVALAEAMSAALPVAAAAQTVVAPQEVVPGPTPPSEPASAAEALQMLSAQQPLAPPPASSPLMHAAPVAVAPVAAMNGTVSEPGLELKPETMAAVSQIVRSLATAQPPEGIPTDPSEAGQALPPITAAPAIHSEIVVEPAAVVAPLTDEKPHLPIEPLTVNVTGSVEPLTALEASPRAAEPASPTIEELHSIEPLVPPETAAPPVESAEIAAIPLEELAALAPAAQPLAAEIPAISVEELTSLMPDPAPPRRAAPFQFDVESLPAIEEPPVLPTVVTQEADQPDLFAVTPAGPALRPGVAWVGEINGQRSSRFEPRGAELAATSIPPVAESAPVPAPVEPLPVDAALWASVAHSLAAPQPVAAEQLTEPALAPAQRPAFEPVAEAVRQAQAAVEQALAQAFPSPVPEPEPLPAPESVATLEMLAEPQANVATAAAAETPPAVDEVGTAVADEQQAATPRLEAEPILAPEPTFAVPPAPAAAPATPQPVFDEDAAMRAIEGGWSRRATRALPNKPELTDVSAAVSAAQVAVEQVLVQTNGDVASADARSASVKPKGIPRPRESVRDNLKLINGLGPLDEAALNNLGIYLFEQVAAWDQKEVLWLENHAFARGRIGREDWQAQARRILSNRDTLRATR
jgi:predicted flap endonuclease-1-like 5' DNA nuclease